MAFVKSVDCRINRPFHEQKQIANRNMNHGTKPITMPAYSGDPGISTGNAQQETGINKAPAASLTETLGSLYAYCMTLTGSVWETEDLVQETCLKAWSSTHAGQKDASPEMNWEAYLVRTARNTWIDQLRKRARLSQKLDSLKPLLADTEHEERFEDLELAVRLLVNGLPPWQRVIYMLRDLLGYTAAETADLLDTTEGAVKAALSRARAALAKIRQRLHDSGSDDPSAGPGYGLREDEQGAEQLRSYLRAFRTGDAVALIDLCLNRSDDPMAVAGTILQALPSQTMQPVLHGQDAPRMLGAGLAVCMVA